MNSRVTLLIIYVMHIRQSILHPLFAISGGVPALCTCLTNFISRDEVTEPVCAALRNVTHRNPQANRAIEEVCLDAIVIFTVSDYVRCIVFQSSRLNRLNWSNVTMKLGHRNKKLMTI